MWRKKSWCTYFIRIFVFFFRQPYLNDMIKFLRHHMKFHKLSRWHEVINQLLHLWNSRSNYPKNAEGEPKYEKSKNSCHIWQKSRVQAHAGSFAQNSFQTNSINSCTTSKKLQFWLKIVGIIYFLTLKPIKGKLGFSLEIMKKIARWPHKLEISKRNVKTMITPL